MHLLDSNLRIGRGLRPARFDTSEPRGAIEMLDYFGIHRALVRSALQERWSAADGNRYIADFCAGEDRLLPVWTLLPFQTGEFPEPGKLLASLAEAGVSVVAWQPGVKLPLEEPVFGGPLLETLSSLHIPLLYPLGSDDDCITVGKILSQVPELTLILCVNHTAWGLERYFWPLFDMYPNFLICTSGYHISGAVQATIQKYGCGRFVFGSGYPALNPGGAVEFLSRLDIPDEDREAVAWKNMQRLIDRVRKHKQYAAADMEGGK